MSAITMKMIRRRGQTVVLGRNVAVKLLLERSTPESGGLLSQNQTGLIRWLPLPWSLKWL
jgi:hypothetical protein